MLAPGFFSGTPTFELPDPKGVLLVPPAESPVVSSEVVADVSYTIQRHEISVFGQRAGELVIPPLTVRFHFKRSPLDKDLVPATIKTEPVRFTAKLPPGAEKLGSVISARNLKAAETWKPEPGNAKAGDAFTRTIIVSAPDVPAMAFPPFPTGQIDGVGIYTKQPGVLDHSERGQLSGERRDTITYVCQRPSRFVIPAARFTWWDLDAHQLRTIDFPARVLDVAPNPALASATPAPAVSAKPSTESDSAWLIIALGAISMLFVPKRLWRRLRAPLRPVHLAPLNPPPRTAEFTIHPHSQTAG
ncbi:hypothetical protein ACXR0O_09880 [Verrucomicrobiota bacterium sgz303538]